MVHGLKNLSLLLTAAIPVVAAFAPLPSSSSSACHALLTSSSSAIVGSQLKLNEVPSSKSSWSTQRTHHLGRLFASSDDESDNEEARRLQEKAQQLRDQIRQMESQIGEERRVRYNSQRDDDDNNNNNNNEEEDEANLPKSLKNKRVLVLGSNGRLGSMIVRHLLRTHGADLKEVVAAVHYVGQATTRGYGRLSYEVGAEDGIGTIGAAWAPEDERNASFEFDPETMAGYHLNKLRLVEVELLDPVQVSTITEDVDAIIYCATDFEGNRPRAVASLNAAFLFRAVANPAKGRVEIEGVRNCLEGLVGGLTDRKWKERLEPGVDVADVDKLSKRSDPTQFVLVSTSPDAFGEFETPFGEFNGLKRQGERIVMEEFPSVSYSVLQMGKFDDNFVEEGQEVQYAVAEEDTVVVDGVINAVKPRASSGGDDGMQKRINRRDAARAAVGALLDEELEGKKVQVYTAKRKTDIW